MSLLHKRSKLQRSLEDRGAELSARRCRELFFGKKKSKREEVDDVAIERGLRALASRVGSSDAVPLVPADVYASMPKCDYDKDYYDVKIVQSDFPHLNDKVIAALMEESDCDLLSSGLMLAVGNYFALQGWDDEDLKKWIQSVRDYRGFSGGSDLSTRSNEELIADLTGLVVYHGYDCTGFHDLEHTAGLVKQLSQEELKQVAKDEQILVDHCATHASLVVKIIEHVFADVLEPAEVLDGEKNKTERAKKQRTRR